MTVWSSIVVATLASLLLPPQGTTAITLPGFPYHYKEGPAGNSMRWTENGVLCGRMPMTRDYTGYIEVGAPDESVQMWFWFFEAHHRPDTAPIALVLPGTPGLAASELVFGPTGPCAWRAHDPWPAANQWTLSRRASLLYVDAPAPAGLSYVARESPREPRAPPLTPSREPEYYVWNLLQGFFRAWPEHTGREVHIWSGDAAAPSAIDLANHVLERNLLVGSPGEDQGASVVRLASLGLESPVLEVVKQYEHSLAYARDNPYRAVLSAGEQRRLRTEYEFDHLRRLKVCALAPWRDCAAQLRGYRRLWRELTVGWWTVYRGRSTWHDRTSFDPLDLRERRSRRTFESLHGRPEHVGRVAPWLSREGVAQQLGARIEGWDHKKEGYETFVKWMEDDLNARQAPLRSSLASLEKVVQSGIRVLLMGGDADLLITPPGLRAIVEEMSWDGREAFLNGTAQPVFATVATADTPKDFGYTPPGQMVVGEYKVGGNLALMKLYDRGHDLTKDDPGIMREIFENHVFGQAYSHLAGTELLYDASDMGSWTAR